MAPWWARQLAVFGSLSPSTTSGKVLFIRDIGEWNSITTPASLDHLLGMGIGPLIETRIGGAIAAAMIYLTLVCGFILAPVAGHRRVGSPPLDRLRAVLRLRCAPVRVLRARLGRPRAGRDVHPLRGRAGALQLHPGPRGDRPRHRLGRRAPVRLGSRMRRCASSAARRWSSRSSSRSPGRSSSTPCGRPGAATSWQSRRRSTPRARRPSDRVMSIDASGTRYWSGHGGVVLVNDPLDTVHDVATAYDIRWLVLDRDDAVSSVAPILDGTERPGLARPADPRRGQPDAPCRLPSAGHAMTRREQVLTAARDLRHRAPGPDRAGRPDRLPEARGHGLLLRRRAEPHRGTRARVRRPVELPDAAARDPARRLRGLAAPAVVAGGDPDGDPGRRRSRHPSGRRSSSARSCRSSPGGSRRTSRRSVACRASAR